MSDKYGTNSNIDIEKNTTYRNCSRQKDQQTECDNCPSCGTPYGLAGLYWLSEPNNGLPLWIAADAEGGAERAWAWLTLRMPDTLPPTAPNAEHAS